MDVKLVLGIIYYQEKNFLNAEKLAVEVLKKVPKYTDARVLYVRILYAKKKFKAAQEQIKLGFKYSPNDKDLKDLQKKVNLAMNQILLPKPLGFDLIEKLYKCLQKQAKCVEKNATYFYERRQYYVAATIAKNILCLDPQDKKAKEIIANIKSASPKYLNGLNEIGGSTENDYVTDVKEWWNYSTIYYTRHGCAGDFNAIINYARRLGFKGTQKEILLVPIFNQYVRMELDAGYSRQLVLFPRYFTRAEVFLSFPKFVDISIGEDYSKLKFTYFKYSTGSISKETEYFYISFRPIHYVPKAGQTSTLYTLNIRAFICKDVDNYLWTNLGTGKSPDLNDLFSVDFITIKNRFVYFGYHFPLFDNKIAINIGGDYQHQVFPNGRVRRLKGGILGLALRF